MLSSVRRVTVGRTGGRRPQGETSEDEEEGGQWRRHGRAFQAEGLACPRTRRDQEAARRQGCWQGGGRRRSW